MHCPNCRAPMAALAAHSHYGARVEIDQCPDCGGLWFDSGELYSIKQGLAETIDKIDRGKLRELDPADPDIACPRHGRALERFRDPNFPASVIVEACPECHGLWFNRGEFRSWQDHRAERQRRQAESRAKQEEENRFDDQIASLMSLRGRDSEESLRHLGVFIAAAHGLPAERFKAADPALERTADAIQVARNLVGLMGARGQGPDPDQERAEALAKAAALRKWLDRLTPLAVLALIAYEGRSLASAEIRTMAELGLAYFRAILAFMALPTLLVLRFFDRLGFVLPFGPLYHAQIFYWFVYGMIAIMLVTRWLEPVLARFYWG